MTFRLFAFLLFAIFLIAFARAETIISEDFESVALGFPPDGWERVDGDGGYCSWFSRPSWWETFSRDNFPAHSGSRVIACFYNDHSVPNDDWLILPAQTLEGPITLSYWAASQDPGFLESFEVRVSTTDDLPASFNHLISSHTNVPEAWTEFTDDLSAFAGETFYVAIHYNAVNQFMLKLDDVTLEATRPPSGTVAGTVTDSAGTPVENARVQIWGTDLELRTDTSGDFLFSYVPPGQFEMGFLHEFFYSHLESGVNVAESETTQVNVQLAPLPLQFADYVSTSSARHIVDYDTVEIRAFNVTVDTVVIYDMDITVNLTHSYVGDLGMWLISPSGRVDMLVQRDPYNDGVNITNCLFDDDAAQAFTAGHAPWTGRFRPAVALSTFRGDSTVVSRNGHWLGAWALDVSDLGAGNDGYLNSFVLHVAWLTGEVSAPPRPAPRPTDFSFAGNYPNPFNAETRFRFYLGRTVAVKLILCNVLGQEVVRLIDEKLPAGEHTLVFDASALSSGVYFARLQAADFSATRKIVLIK